MRLLDLFCGAGGAAMGYHRAGFEVVGVDINPQPRYLFEFHQGDALEYPLDGFDVIHASPPCQRWVGWRGVNALRGSENDHPDFLTPILERVRDRFYVVENVIGAPLRSDAIRLCGSFFGLRVSRHRLFQLPMFTILEPGGGCRHTGEEIGVYGREPDGRRLYTRKDGSIYFCASSIDDAKDAMGVPWMETWEEVKESIPPAYTRWIGSQLIDVLRR